MDFPHPIKSFLATSRLHFGCLVAFLLLMSTGCGPVGSRSQSQSPFGGGLFNSGNNLANNSSPTGFGGGFGQSVFGDRSGTGQSGQLFGSNAGSGSNNVAIQQPRFPQPNPNQQAFAAQSQNQNQLASQVNSLNQRVTAFDADNQLLNTELASLKQKLQLSENYGQTLKQQLADSSSQIQQFDRERQQLAATQLQLQQLQQQNQDIQQQLAQAQQASRTRTFWRPIRSSKFRWRSQCNSAGSGESSRQQHPAATFESNPYSGWASPFGRRRNSNRVSVGYFVRAWYLPTATSSAASFARHRGRDQARLPQTNRRHRGALGRHAAQPFHDDTSSVNGNPSTRDF